MGNRDINKMRIADELGTNTIVDQNDSLPKHGGVYWLNNKGAASARSGPPTASVNPTEGVVLPSATSASDRLQWMLKRTMGCVDSFELRRCELERERIAVANATSVSLPRRDGNVGKNGSANEGAAIVTDEEVTQSYIRSCDPVSGIMSL